MASIIYHHSSNEYNRPSGANCAAVFRKAIWRDCARPWRIQHQRECTSVKQGERNGGAWWEEEEEIKENNRKTNYISKLLNNQDRSLSSKSTHGIFVKNTQASVVVGSQHKSSILHTIHIQGVSEKNRSRFLIYSV